MDIQRELETLREHNKQLAYTVQRYALKDYLNKEGIKIFDLERQIKQLVKEIEHLNEVVQEQQVEIKDLKETNNVLQMEYDYKENEVDILQEMYNKLLFKFADI